jgi:hypothetical protein
MKIQNSFVLSVQEYSSSNVTVSSFAIHASHMCVASVGCGQGGGFKDCKGWGEAASHKVGQLISSMELERMASVHPRPPPLGGFLFCVERPT